jgi:hypothetical protein
MGTAINRMIGRLQYVGVDPPFPILKRRYVMAPKARDAIKDAYHSRERLMKNILANTRQDNRLSRPLVSSKIFARFSPNGSERESIQSLDGSFVTTAALRMGRMETFCLKTRIDYLESDDRRSKGGAELATFLCAFFPFRRSQLQVQSCKLQPRYCRTSGAPARSCERSKTCDLCVALCHPPHENR